MHRPAVLSLSAFIAALLLAAVAAPMNANALDDVFTAQQEAVENPGGGMRVVTPLKDCLDKLPPEDAAAVQRNYMKPYQECLLRLRALESRGAAPTSSAPAEGKTADSTDGTGTEKEPPAAATPRNFVRVRPDDGPRIPARHGDVRHEEDAPRRPAWDAGYNR